MLDKMLSRLYTSEVSTQHEVQNQIRQYRLKVDMTQQELADRIGVSRQSILSVERGKYTPSVALALCLAKVFDVSVEALFQLTHGDHDG